MRDGIDDFRQQIQEPAGRKKRAPGWQMPLELAARFDTASFTVDAPKRRLQQRPVCRAGKRNVRARRVNGWVEGAAWLVRRQFADALNGDESALQQRGDIAIESGRRVKR